jgi:hypothetical protein
LSFVGLVHSCLETPQGSLDEAFGPVRAFVYTNRAKGDPKPRATGTGTIILWFLGTVLKARLNGDYRRTPFFDAKTGALVATPRVLSPDEHTRLMSAVRGVDTA